MTWKQNVRIYGIIMSLETGAKTCKISWIGPIGGDTSTYRM